MKLRIALFTLLTISVAAGIFVNSTNAATVYNQSTFTQGMTPLTGPTVIWPPPQTYTMSTFTKGMTPLTSGTVLFGTYDVDDSAVSFTLPFTFQYYGANYTTAGVSSNGLFTFGTSNSSLGNTTIPQTGTPNAFVAPFWDDCYVYTSLGSKVWYTVQGSSPNRVCVIEFFKIAHYGYGTSYYATAQVKLYETSWTVEICYDNNNQNWGGIYTATIGIEDTNGTGGYDATGAGANNNNCPSVNYRFQLASTTYDDASQSVALPFTFQYYGNFYANVIVSTNGFITFSSGGDTSPNNATIPTAAVPNEYIALFWDDLQVIANGVQDKIQYGTLGTSPNRVFVVEYYYVTRSGQSGSEMTGQILLYETSNRIELQYATGSANTWSGVTATIGVEDSTGAVGTGGPNTNNNNSTCPTVNYRFDPVQTCTLQVTSPYGTPNPAVGTHTYNGSTSVTCSVNSPVAGPTGTRYVCTGWTGTGDVSASGTGTSTTFTINQNSSITWVWQTEYSIALTASPSGAGTLSNTPSGSWIPAGASVQISASPTTGYLFNNWTGTQTSTSNPHTFTMSGPETITGNFWAMQFTLNIMGSPAQYGTPTPAYGAVNYSYGTSMTCTINSPIAGPTGTRYRCTGWTGTGDVPATGTGLSVSFTMTQNSSLTWVWVTEYQLTLAATPSGYGTVSSNPVGPWIASGTSVQITANANSGYMFQYWTGLVTTSSNPETFVLMGPGTVTANFVVQMFFLNVTSAYGSPSPSGTTLYNLNASITCSVSSPVSGGSGVRYVCTGWTGTGSVPASGTGLTTTFNISVDSTITWNWVAEYEVTTNDNPSGSGTVTLNPSGPWFRVNDAVQVTATPTAQYHFVSWGGGLSGTNNPETLTVSSSTNVTGNFQPNGPSLTVASAYGAPSPSVGSMTYFAGSQLTLSVTSPVSGALGTRYYCTGWTGTGDVPSTGSLTTLNVTLNNDSTITWVWTAEYELTSSTSPYNAGVVTWAPAGSWFPSGAAVTLSATANSGYTFLSWSDGVSTTDNPAVVLMTGPRSVVANFMTPRVLGVAAGPANPASTLETGSATGLPMLHVRFTAGSAETIRLESVSVRVSGSSDETATVVAARCYLDVDGDGSYNALVDLPVDGAKTFSGNNGSLTFVAMPPITIPAGESRYLLFTFDLNASPGDDFQLSIPNASDIQADLVASNSQATIIGTPVGGGVKTVAAPGTQGSVEVYRGGASPEAGLVRPGTGSVPMLQLLVRAGSLEGISVTALTLSATGSGDDSTGITGIRLYRDTNGNGILEAGEGLLGSAAGFGADNGTATFFGLSTLIPAGGQETWLVVADLSGSADGDFRVGVASSAHVTATGVLSASSLVAVGLPMWGSAITAGYPPVIKPSFFIGGCGGGAGSSPSAVLPLLLLAGVLGLLGIRRTAIARK